MLNASSIGGYIDHVNKALVELVDSVPDDKMDWSPQPDLWNFRGIFLHIPMTRHHWLAGIIGDGEAIPDVVRECQTKPGLREQLVLSSARLRRFVSNRTLLDAEYSGEWNGKAWRHSGHWIAFQLLEHDIHHRATIFDYLALLGLPHPSFETLTFSASDGASSAILARSRNGVLGGSMATWAEFAAAEPAMARRGFEQLSIPVAYLATVRKDGAPRVHPLSPMFANGRLFVAIQATAPRRYDLANDGRYSLHALPPMLGPDYDEFEFNVAGRARLVTEPAIREGVNASERARNRPDIEDDAWMFELDIEMALTTVWNHKMAQVDGRWVPALGEMPTATHKVWRA